jgi:sterol 24-C-methyltransferase
LKPGGSLVGYDWCITDKYDETNADHVEIKRLIEEGDALPELGSTHHMVSQLESVGFNVEESRIIPEGDIPWHQPLKGGKSMFSFDNFRTTMIGRWLTRSMIWLMETSHIAAQGSLAALEILEKAGDSLVRAGDTGIFTPYFFFLARKSQRIVSN